MKTDLTTNYDILSNEQQALPINKDNWFKYNKIKSEDKECTLKNLHNYL